MQVNHETEYNADCDCKLFFPHIILNMDCEENTIKYRVVFNLYKMTLNPIGNLKICWVIYLHLQGFLFFHSMQEFLVNLKQ